MPSRPTRKTKSVVAKAAELAVAVPQVVAHRMARMAIAGPTLFVSDGAMPATTPDSSAATSA